MARPRHVHDDQLFDCYFRERTREPIDPALAEHLAGCVECQVRYDDLVRFMDGLRLEADAEIDQVFPPDHLRATQQQIARRLEHLGHAARIITFPGRNAGRHVAGIGSRVVPRWAAAAAAACLFAGVALGMFYDGRSRRAPSTAAPPSARIAAPAARMPAPAPPDAEELLSEIDLVLGGPRTPELLPFHALTPTVREISTPVR